MELLCRIDLKERRLSSVFFRLAGWLCITTHLYSFFLVQVVVILASFGARYSAPLLAEVRRDFASPYSRQIGDPAWRGERRGAGGAQVATHTRGLSGDSSTKCAANVVE